LIIHHQKALEIQPGDANALEAIAAAEAQSDTAANLMSNPAIRQMAAQVNANGAAGGPDFANIMNDPNLMNMAMNGEQRTLFCFLASC
jgi:hypothetical protein